MKRSAVLLGVMIAAAPVARAQERADPSLEALARRLQDPLSDLSSLQLVYEPAFNRFGDGRRDLLEIDQVLPEPLGDQWRLVSRALLPVIREPEPIDEGGFGDLTATFHLAPTPRRGGLLRWGAGAALLFPTASQDELGRDKYGLGPSGAFVTVQGPWVAGLVARNVWSIGGSGDLRVNELVAQPFAHYEVGEGWSLGSEPTITADWKAPGGSVWTLPLGGGIARVLRVGPNGVVPLHFAVGAYYHVVHPDDGPLWSMRFELSFLIPGAK